MSKCMVRVRPQAGIFALCWETNFTLMPLMVPVRVKNIMCLLISMRHRALIV